MDITLHTNGIAIIEFLGEQEYKTGRSVLDSYIKPTWLECDNKFYFYAPTKGHVINALNTIIDASKNQGFHPLIHLESHGSEFGLSATPSGEEQISWLELKPYFQEINMYSQFNTVVFVSACSGAHFVSAIDTTDKAPFWGIVGPIETARAEDLLEDYGNFYRSFLNNFSFFDAFRLLNKFKEEGNRSYHFYTADQAFISIWAAYIRTEGSKEAMDKRVSRIMSKAPSVSGAGKKAHSQMREKLLKQLGDHRAYFEKLRRTYFMDDIMPGMSERFGVTYEKVLEKLASPLSKNPLIK